MICKVENCQRDDSKRRFKMGYCDGHYQRLYFSKDLYERIPVKEYPKHGTGNQIINMAVDLKHDRCLDWPLGKDGKGYGAVYYNGKRWRTHRLVKILSDGIDNPPPTVFACHKCDNPSCINPNHIYWGTAKTNSSDQSAYYTLQQ